MVHPYFSVVILCVRVSKKAPTLSLFDQPQLCFVQVFESQDEWCVATGQSSQQGRAWGSISTHWHTHLGQSHFVISNKITLLFLWLAFSLFFSDFWMITCVCFIFFACRNITCSAFSWCVSCRCRRWGSLFPPIWGPWWSSCWRPCTSLYESPLSWKLEQVRLDH